MISDLERPAANDLHALLALVAGSNILAGPALRPKGAFAGWEKECQSADVDAMVLAWIASHARGVAHRGRLH